MRSLFNYKEEIDQRLDLFFKVKTEGTSGIDKTVIEGIRDFTMRGGKRIRPIFMIMGYLLGADLDSRIIDASISLELMQSYMLIHDDIIDKSDTRRNAPTLHKAFSYDERTNIGLAIIAADLANAYCHEVLITSDFSSEVVRKALGTMEKAYEVTGIGQLNDMILPFRSNISLDDVTNVHRLKTAEYTIGGPMKIGASLSGYEKPDLIDLYSIPLGIAFQMQDDTLGLFGDEKTLGKSVKSDVKEGKITHMVVFAESRVTRGEKYFMKAMLGNEKITDNEFEEFKEIIKKSGALDEAEKLINLYYRKALGAIPMLTEDNEKRKELKFLADKMINRTS